MLAVVASFLAITVVVQGRERALDRYVEDIRGNAMPSVQYLSAARGELHFLDRYVDAYADAAEHGQALPRDPIAQHRGRLDAALQHYLALPFFPGEQAQYRYVQDALDAFDRTVAAVVAAVEEHDSSIIAVAQGDEEREVERVDTALQHLVDYDAGQAERLGEQIARTRSSATTTAYALDGFCAALAMIAVVLAALSLRQRLRELEHTGQAAVEQAESADRRSKELDQFAGRVAHDVLSPLSAVAFALELSRMRVDDRATLAILGRGQSSLQRVHRLVTDLLQFARSGAQAPSGVSVRVADVLGDVVEAVRQDAEKARVEVVLEDPGDERAACAPGVLTSMVANLARNAVKHMGDSPIRLVSVSSMAHYRRVRIEVRDTGPGVPPSIADRIFEPFVRASTSPGVGLGLATVRRLAMAHHGAAGYAPAPGGGSVFWIELPQDVADSGRALAVGSASRRLLKASTR